MPSMNENNKNYSAFCLHNIVYRIFHHKAFISQQYGIYVSFRINVESTWVT